MKKLIVFFLSLLLLCACLAACKDSSSAPTPDEAPHQYTSSVVMLRCDGAGGVPNRLVSGFLVNDGRTVYTHYSALKDTLVIKVYSHLVEGLFFVDKVLYADEKSGIAILRLKEDMGLPGLTPGSSEDLSENSTVYAAYTKTSEDSHIPVLTKTTVASYPRGLFPLDADNDEHSVGGAVLDINGKVVGVICPGGDKISAAPSDAFKKVSYDPFYLDKSIGYDVSRCGNSYPNYSLGADIVEYNGCIYHCMNPDNEITLTNIKTKLSVSLGIYGTCLSIYDDVLYYVTPDNLIGIYGLITSKNSHGFAANILSVCETRKIHKLLVDKNGVMAFVYLASDSESGYYLLHLGHDGKLKSTTKLLNGDAELSPFDLPIFFLAPDIVVCYKNITSDKNLPPLYECIHFVPAGPFSISQDSLIEIDGEKDQSRYVVYDGKYHWYISDATADSFVLNRYHKATESLVTKKLKGEYSSMYPVGDTVYYSLANGDVYCYTGDSEPELFSAGGAPEGIFYIASDGTLFAPGK